jgi:hypothetical protein
MQSLSESRGAGILHAMLSLCVTPFACKFIYGCVSANLRQFPCWFVMVEPLCCWDSTAIFAPYGLVSSGSSQAELSLSMSMIFVECHFVPHSHTRLFPHRQGMFQVLLCSLKGKSTLEHTKFNGSLSCRYPKGNFIHNANPLLQISI